MKIRYQWISGEDEEDFELQNKAMELFFFNGIYLIGGEEPVIVAISPRGKIVGAISQSPIKEDDGEHYISFSVVVDPKYRRKGIGKNLVQKLLSNSLELVQDNVIQSIVAYVVNKDAMFPLLSSIGFVHTDHPTTMKWTRK